MIVESLLRWFSNFMQLMFSSFQAFTLPVELLAVLIELLAYGTWVIGADLMAIVIANIVFWMATKFTIGLALFVWRLLPLT